MLSIKPVFFSKGCSLHSLPISHSNQGFHKKLTHRMSKSARYIKIYILKEQQTLKKNSQKKKEIFLFILLNIFK